MLPPFLITQPEGITRCIDFSDRSSAGLFGDACTAAVLSLTEARVNHHRDELRRTPSAWEKVSIPLSHFRQDGHAVQGFAIRRMTEALASPGLKALADTDVSGSSATRQTSGRSGPSANGGNQPENHWHNVDFGNTGSAGASSVLSEHWDELAPGDRVAICLSGRA